MLSNCATTAQMKACRLCTVKQQLLLRKLLSPSTSTTTSQITTDSSTSSTVAHKLTMSCYASHVRGRQMIILNQVIRYVTMYHIYYITIHLFNNNSTNISSSIRLYILSGNIGSCCRRKKVALAAWKTWPGNEIFILKTIKKCWRS